MKKQMRTMVVRIEKGGPVYVFRHDCFDSQKEYATTFRGYGFKVLKIWNGNIPDSEIKNWLDDNRQDYYGI